VFGFGGLPGSVTITSYHSIAHATAPHPHHESIIAAQRNGGSSSADNAAHGACDYHGKGVSASARNSRPAERPAERQSALRWLRGGPAIHAGDLGRSAVRSGSTTWANLPSRCADKRQP
jgi:hypothetical protein